MKLDVTVVSSNTIDSQNSSDTSGNSTTQLVEQEKGVVTLDDELDDENVSGVVVRLGTEDVDLAELASAF